VSVIKLKPEEDASLWKRREQYLNARAFAASQREHAAVGRAEGSEVRAEASAIRAEAARARDDGARTRDDAARVRDSAALIRDKAALARDNSTNLRQEALRLRLARSEALDHKGWKELLDLDRSASEQAREAAKHDREAASLDRAAAEKDREATDRDRTAADRDRAAADKDRLAAEKEAEAADSDRAAADSDRIESDYFLELAETRLFKSERLTTIGRLATELAHEINNPLTTLTATLGQVQLQVQNRDFSPENLESLLSNAVLATERITQIVCDVKGWIQDGKDKAARGLIDVPKLINQSLYIVKLAIDPIARLVVELGPLPPLWGVEQRLSQVISNLLLNSVHAISGPKGDNEIRIRVRTDGQQIRIEVSDTGSGIPPEVLPHVFDPFFTTHECSGGTGLGLPMCRNIIEAHGGVLNIQNTSPSGTTFVILLPSGTANSMEAHTPDQLPSTHATKAQLLLIDDDPFICEMMTLMLQARCDVTIAHDGRAGLEKILDSCEKWDLVICDLMMPVMSGAEVYRALRESCPIKASEMVFLTSGGIAEDDIKFLDELPNVLLKKPFSLVELQTLLDERLGIHSPV
jgi:C4-dicarboxylate-specific signal transduction histidine kinase/CheY-like chemotaxis protein